MCRLSCWPCVFQADRITRSEIVVRRDKEPDFLCETKQSLNNKSDKHTQRNKTHILHCPSRQRQTNRCTVGQTLGRSQPWTVAQLTGSGQGRKTLQCSTDQRGSGIFSLKRWRVGVWLHPSWQSSMGGWVVGVGWGGWVGVGGLGVLLVLGEERTLLDYAYS